MTFIGIGVDSGGTHTTMAVNRLGEIVLTEANESSHSLAESRSSPNRVKAADWIISRILDMTRPGDDVCVWIGAAAGVTSATVRDFSEIFQPCIGRLSASARDCEVFIANDALSILKAPLYSAAE